MAAGGDLYVSCVACHGKQGEGGVGPPLADVRVTFPDCATHVEWVRLGSVRWKEEVGPTYGSADRRIEGNMPSFDDLTDVQLRQIAFYERVRFGAAEPEGERTACGLSAP